MKVALALFYLTWAMFALEAAVLGYDLAIGRGNPAFPLVGMAVVVVCLWSEHRSIASIRRSHASIAESRARTAHLRSFR